MGAKSNFGRYIRRTAILLIGIYLALLIFLSESRAKEINEAYENLMRK